MEPNDARTRGISEPAKLVRLVTMTRNVLDELQHDRPHGRMDVAARERAHSSHTESLHALKDLLPDDDRLELERLTAPFEPAASPPTQTELRLAEAQLSGWLEGLLKGLEVDDAIQDAGARVREAADLEEADRQADRRRTDERRGYK